MCSKKVTGSLNFSKTSSQGCILCTGSPGKWGGKKNEKFDEGEKKMNFS